MRCPACNAAIDDVTAVAGQVRCVGCGAESRPDFIVDGSEAALAHSLAGGSAAESLAFDLDEDIMGASPQERRQRATLGLAAARKLLAAAQTPLARAKAQHSIDHWTRVLANIR